MSDQWYFVQGGESRGPLSRRELKGLAEAGELKSATLVWKEGMEDWTPAGSLGLLNGPPPVKPPIQPPPLASPAKKAPSLPAPPAHLTAPPPRPISRHIPDSSQHTRLFAATGIALVAGLAIGWLAHAMLVPPREKQVAAAPATSPKVVATTKPFVAPTKTPAVIAAQTTLNPSAPVAPPPVEAPVNSEPTEPSPAAPPVTGLTSSPPAAAPTTASDPAPASSSPPPTTAGIPAASPSTSQSSRSQSVPKLTLYQEIDVQRASKMPILETVSLSHYQFLSQLDVSDPDAEGIRTVGQSVLDTRLLKADELSQAQLADSLKKLKGWQFSYTLSKDGEVLKMMAGPADAPVAGKVAPKGAEGFIVTSVMDEAGWKELAQISFYVPDEQASGNKRQLRQMTHDFGPLGSFTGETSFVRKGMQQGLLRIDYAHKLAYRAPGKGAAFAGSPLTVSSADLRPDVAGGSIWYDQKAKRVRQAEDHFHVKGEIATNIAALPIEEQQAMTVKLTDVNPWSR